MTEPDSLLSRRRFLGGAAVLGLALAPPLLWLGDEPPPQDPDSRATARLAGLFRDPEEIAPLGRRHLEERDHGVEIGELLNEVLPPEVTREQVIAASDEQLRAAVDGWMASDLAAEQIEEVDGWLLSRTGVRLAALTVRWYG